MLKQIDDRCAIELKIVLTHSRISRQCFRKMDA
ncbi:Uncharacterised protein [Vibrio cholerae]|nr:Uncharacterised protein [Vibrio cholerae]CSI36143.1 Uncharacterised protein [Vibrio cholerae]